MSTCPNCGHKIKANLPASNIELSLSILQKQLNTRAVSLKREIARRYGVKKFADVPEDKYPEVLEFATARVEELTTCWGVNKAMEILIPEILKSVPGATRKLGWELEKILRKETGDQYWVNKNPDEAVEAIKQIIGDRNVWEYAFGQHETTGTG